MRAASSTSAVVDMNGTTDYAEVRMTTSGVATAYATGATYTFFSGALVGGGGSSGSGGGGIAAWATFSGTTGALISGSNVSSVTRTGQGQYTATFASALPNTNYAVLLSGTNAGSGEGDWASVGNVGGGRSTGNVKVVTHTTAGGFMDYPEVSIVVLHSSAAGGMDTLAALSCSNGQIPKWNGTAWACAADGGGAGSASSIFLAHRNGVLQIVAAGSAVAINWTHENFDATNAFDPVTGRFAPQVAGRYAVTASAYCADAANYCQVRIYKNASSVVSSNFTYTDSTESVAQTSTVVDMNGTTDYLWVAVINSSGTTLSGSPALTYFTGFLTGGSGSDTLASLSCTNGEIPKWNGAAWACAADSGGTGVDPSVALSATFSQSAADGAMTPVAAMHP